MSAGGNALELLTALIEQSRGDLLFLRPDTWLMPRESAISQVVGRAVAAGGARGRSTRSAPCTRRRRPCSMRVDEGEEVRLIDDLPTRLFVISGTHAILPEPLGFADAPRLLVRQGALVDALTLLFELYWEKAVPVSELRARAASGRSSSASSRRAPRTSRSPAPWASACAPSAVASRS